MDVLIVAFCFIHATDLVKWRGFDDSYNTWEDTDTFDRADMELVHKFDVLSPDEVATKKKPGSRSKLAAHKDSKTAREKAAPKAPGNQRKAEPGEDQGLCSQLP